MDQLAERAGFKYHNTYSFLPALPEYPRKSWDEYLAWAVATYDIVAERFMLTTQRQVGPTCYELPVVSSSLIPRPSSAAGLSVAASCTRKLAALLADLSLPRRTRRSHDLAIPDT